MDRLRNPKETTEDQLLLPLITTTQTRCIRVVADVADEAEETLSVKEDTTVHWSRTMATLANPLTLLRVSQHLPEEEGVVVEAGTRADTRPEEEEEAAALFQEEEMSE